jgi:hypothetical protein
MAFGDMKSDDVKLLKNWRYHVEEEMISANAIYLFAGRVSVKAFNEKKFNN